MEFLVTKGLDETEIQIAHLEEKRSNIAAKLEAYRLAVEAMIGRPAQLKELIEPIKDHRGIKMEIALVKLWLKCQGNTVPINDELLLDAVEYPLEVSKTFKYGRDCLGISTDPARYWDKESSSFVAVPVSEEEKKQIRRRNHRYTLTEEDAETLQFTRNLVRLINFGNQHLDSTPIALGDIRNSPFKPLTAALKVVGNYRGNSHPKFALDEEIFLKKPFPYQAFDE